MTSDARDRIREMVLAFAGTTAKMPPSSKRLERSVTASLERAYGIVYGINISENLAAPENDEQISQDNTMKYRVATCFLELEQTFLRIRNFDVYLRRYPFAGTPITRVDHLRIGVEAYLNEIYILRCRIKNLLNALQDALSGGTKIERLWRAFREVDSSLKSILKARHRNVHHKRFDDEDLSMLTLFEILSVDNERFRRQFDLIYKPTRYRWIKIVRRNAEHLTVVLEFVYQTIEDDIQNILDDRN